MPFPTTTIICVAGPFRAGLPKAHSPWIRTQYPMNAKDTKLIDEIVPSNDNELRE